MPIADTLNPPIQYNILWALLGILLLLVVAIWYVGAFWSTRPKAIKTIDDLKQLPVGDELARLKAKYLDLVEQTNQKYQRKEITKRRLHKDLSMIVRYFVLEVKHFPAPTLTLSDLRRGPFPSLTAVITAFYPDEFDAIEHSDAAGAVAAAKEMILQWV